MDSGFQVLDPEFLAVELGFRIFQSLGIPDFLSCTSGPKSEDPDSASTNFPDSPDSTFSLHGPTRGDFPVNQLGEAKKKYPVLRITYLSSFPRLLGYYAPTTKSPL